MNYYTATIPDILALDLEQLGFRAEWEYVGTEEYGDDISCLTTYAEVIDWFMGKGINIYIVKAKSCDMWHYIVNRDEANSSAIYFSKWNEAADFAVKTAMKHIKQ